MISYVAIDTLENMIMRAVREGVAYAPLREAQVPVEPAEVVALRESIYASMSSGGDTKSTQAMRDKGALYNAHSSAAHATTTSAYRNGNTAWHKVAAEHQKMAGDAADDCTGHCDPKDKKAYEAAKKYHHAQSSAHNTAADAAKTGNSMNSYDYGY